MQIPAADIPSIDYVQKLAHNNIALFKKSKHGARYQGYYLVNVADLNNAKAAVKFVSAKALEIKKENCDDVSSAAKIQTADAFALTKASICSNFVGNTAIEVGTPYLNAYSNQSDASIFFTNDQTQFKMISLNGKVSTVFEKSSKLIATNFNASKKVLAYGEVPNSTAKKAEAKLLDIQFINENGSVLRANSANDKNGNYVELAKLNAEKIKNVFGAFLLPEGLNTPSYVYFLNKDGTYDIKDSAYNIYAEVPLTNKETRKIVDLFPMIPESEFASIDFVQKLPNQKIALFKKHEGKYVGYFIVSSKDVAEKNELGEVTYVTFLKEAPATPNSTSETGTQTDSPK